MTKDPKYDQFGGTGFIVAHTIWRLPKVVGACVMIHLGLSKNDTYPGICCLPLISKMAMENPSEIHLLQMISLHFVQFFNLFPQFVQSFPIFSHGNDGDLPWFPLES